MSEKRQASLFKVVKQKWINDSLPPLQHFAIAYRVDDSNWLLVDPNSGLSSMMPNPQQMNEARAQLEQHKQTAPGASLLFRNTQEEQGYQQNLRADAEVLRISRSDRPSVGRDQELANFKTVTDRFRNCTSDDVLG